MVTEQDISRRNKRLLSFFQKSGVEVRLIGNENCPAVVYMEKLILSCYVKNFNLIFTSKPYQGEEVLTVKLTQGAFLEKEYLLNIIDKCEHRRAYRVKMSNAELYLSGYNFLDKENLQGRYPVFSRFNSKVYFDKDYAETICKDYAEYNLIVV